MCIFDYNMYLGSGAVVGPYQRPILMVWTCALAVGHGGKREGKYLSTHCIWQTSHMCSISFRCRLLAGHGLPRTFLPSMTPSPHWDFVAVTFVGRHCCIHNTLVGGACYSFSSIRAGGLASQPYFQSSPNT